jgi:hypothetical protein
MLTRLLSVIEQAGGPVRLEELSRLLGVERSALTPMLDLLGRKGLLSEWAQAGGSVACSSGCGTSCSGIEGCPFVAGALPRVLEVAPTVRLGRQATPIRLQSANMEQNRREGRTHGLDW